MEKGWILISPDEINGLLRRYISEVWDKADPTRVDEFLAPNYRRHLTPSTEPLTLAGQTKLLAGFRAAFPDVRLTLEDVVVQGDRVAFRSTMRGTHQGTFQGIAPTGKQVEVSLLDLIRIENGRFAEQWGGPNVLDLLQQLGAEVQVP
jgi:predicted ester cyclase